MTLRSRIPSLVALVAFGALQVAQPRPASAKILELTLRVHGGGIAGLYGTENYDPLSSDPDLAAVSGKDFFKERRGAAFGATAGIEVFFIDVIYEFYQLADADGLGSTLNNILLGFDWDFKAGEHWVFTPYIVSGIGLATQNNSWLKKKYPQIALEDLNSRIVQVRIGLQIERRLGRFFRIGFEVGAGYHYMITAASDTAANDLEGHSHGFHVLGNISLAFVWDPFEPKKKTAVKKTSGPQWQEDNSQTPAPTGRPDAPSTAPVREPPPAAPVRETTPAPPPREPPPPAKQTPPSNPTPPGAPAPR